MLAAAIAMVGKESSDATPLLLGSLILCLANLVLILLDPAFAEAVALYP